MNEHSLIEFLDRLATGIFSAILVMLYLYARSVYIKHSTERDEYDLPEPTGENVKKIKSGSSIKE